MVERHSPGPDPATNRPSGPPQSDTPATQGFPANDEHLDRWEEDDEPYTDPEHARRLAAVRTELFRRAQATWTPEE